MAEISGTLLFENSIHLTVTVYDLSMQELDAHSRVPTILELSQKKK